MSFGTQLKARREALGLSRGALAERLGVSASAIGNYETGVSFPKEDVLLRLFDALRAEPNTLFRDSYRLRSLDLTAQERELIEKCRSLSPLGRRTVRDVADALCGYRDELTEERGERSEPRLIPFYTSPAAAGYAAPEQYGITQTDERADIYSLGVLLNIMLTGKHPSKELASGRLGRIVQKCTMVNPKKRYKSVLYLMETL